MNQAVEPPDYELDKISRIKIANSIYVVSPAIKDALISIDRCRNSFKIKPEPNCILVYGDRGTGKTSLIRRYIHENQRRQLDDGSTHLPVFMCEVHAASTVSQFYSSVLKGLGDLLPEKGSTTAKGERLHRLLRDLGTELIIIDEFHELLDGQVKKVMTNVASAIKTLINQTKIPVVLSGTGTAKMVLDANQELRRRFRTSVELPRFTIFSEDEIIVFRKFLAKYDKSLPFKDVSNLAGPDMYKRIFAASIGLPSGVASLISEASELAIYAGADRIEMEHLAEGYEIALGDQTHIAKNPFEVSMSDLKQWKVMNFKDFPTIAKTT